MVEQSPGRSQPDESPQVAEHIDMQMASFRSVENVVHFSAGVGRNPLDRTVDLTRLGRMGK